MCLCGILCLFSACKDHEIVSGLEENKTSLFAGPQQIITLTNETKNFHYPNFRCKIKAEDGTEFTRNGEHLRMSGKSILSLQVGLRTGVYRLLSLQIPVVETPGADTTWVEYGLGCRIQVSGTEPVQVLDSYQESLGFSGSGTEADPYIISSYSHLKQLRNIANDQVQNELLTPKTYFRQVTDIDMDKASWDSDHQFGWYPIGSQVNNPFRGVYDGGGYSIKNIWSLRSSSAGIGLFGYVEKAYIKHIKMENPRMEGNFAVGSIIGGSVTSGNATDTTFVSACSVTNGYVKAGSGSVGIGGMVGTADMKSVLLMDSCINNSTPVSGDYAVGGILGAGALYSLTAIQQCENYANVTSAYTGAGGIAGSVDSLYVMACRNAGKILGATNYKTSDTGNGGFGTGGIVGGAGVSFIYASGNSGEIQGAIGVGGIIGSTRIGSDETMLNNTLLRSCSNTAPIKGQTSVGGLCGEAQFGCYKVYNSGDVQATAQSSNVGGIAGNTSIAVAHNALNAGKVTASSGKYVGGVMGKTTWGAVFACQNYGDVDVSADYVGGLIGMAGNKTMVNYCANMGNITNSGKGLTSGLIGEIGDPREWSPIDIVSCVLGSMECVLGIAGPVIAITGEAVESGTAAMKTLHEVLHITEKVTDAIVILGDASVFIFTSCKMASEEEEQLMHSSVNAKSQAIDDEVTSAMNGIRNSYAISPKLLATGLNGGVYNEQINNLNSVLSFYGQSDDNNNIINYNINHNREERYEKIEKHKHIKEIVQKVIAGTCIVVSTVAGIASGLVTGGTTAAATLVAVGAISSTVGGVNAIVEGATDYQNNAVIVSQCANMGKVKAQSGDKTGGILAHAQQYCLIRDCVNSGPFEGSKNIATAGIVGRADSKAEIQNCLNVGDGWNAPLVGSIAGQGLLTRSYYYNITGITSYDLGIPLKLDKLNDPKSYSKWSMSGDRALWKVSSGSGNFPVPFHSELENPIEE